MIPNASGGLHVGLGIEPTVSNSIEETAKMPIQIRFAMCGKETLQSGRYSLMVKRHILAVSLKLFGLTASNGRY